jgi:hypothetical protein
VVDLEAGEEVDALAAGPNGAKEQEEAGDASKARLRVSEPFQNTVHDCQHATLLFKESMAPLPEAVILSLLN